MHITKFVLNAGRIEFQSNIDSDLLNVRVYREAREALQWLRTTPLRTTYKLPLPPLSQLTGASPFEVGLGMPGYCDWEQLEKMQSDLPPDRPRLSREYWEASLRDSRRTDFYVRRTNHFSSFMVVPVTLSEDDPALYGRIAGSFAGAQASLPAEQRSTALITEELPELHATMTQIWSARPSLMVEPLSTDKDFPHSFADCLAAAMLLSPEE